MLSANSVIEGVLQADKKDASCSLDRYSCLAEASQCAPTSAAPSMPGIQRQFIPQAGRHPPGAPTRKLPSNMWDSAIADNKHHSPDWSAQLPERASGLLHKPLIADPITSTNGLLLRLESAKTGSLTSKVLDSASSAYTGTFAALHNDSSRLPMQLYKEGPSSAQLPPIMEDSFVGRQPYISHRSSCLAQIPCHPCTLPASLLTQVTHAAHRLQFTPFVRCQCPGQLEGSMH